MISDKDLLNFESTIIRLIIFIFLVLPCEVSPCRNGGICTNDKEDGFKCACKNGFGGTFCDRKGNIKILSAIATNVYSVNKFWVNNCLCFQMLSICPLSWRGKPIILSNFRDGWKLCYRASRDGWRSSNFHTRCDYKGPTVTIVRVGYYIFGGYADVAWGGMEFVFRFLY